jgi:hypothetical protein
VDYVTGLQMNAALLRRVALAELYLADAYKDSATKQRLIGDFHYGPRAGGASAASSPGWSMMPTAPTRASSLPA